jgi:TatD DNase family protein
MRMNTGYVDFHCHLDLYPDPAYVINEAEAAGVYTLTVTTTPKAWPRNYELTRQTQYVRAALGLHPQLIHERAHEIELWEEYLPQTRYVGEVGIDAGPRHYRSLPEQKQVFERILRGCARAGGKILTVHSVRAAKLVLELVEEHLPADRGRVVLHWFTGSKSEARRAAEFGCYFSVNAQMMQSEKGRQLVASLPLERLLTETDGPFTEVNGRPTCPSDAAHAVEAIANLLQNDPDEIAAKIRRNLKVLLGTTDAQTR